MPLRSPLQAIVNALLSVSHAKSAISLDAFGDAIGTVAVTPDEIGEMMDALERAGRPVEAPQGGRGVGHLRAVLESARLLRGELGRAPTAAQIAAHAGIPLEAVRHALGLARVMQR